VTVSLRGRLLVALLVLLTCGLAVADLATWTELRSFLLGRVDQQLDSAHRRAEQSATYLLGGLGDPRARGAGRQFSADTPGVFAQVRDSGNRVVATSAWQGPDAPPGSPRLPERLPDPGGSPHPGDLEGASYLTVPAARVGGPDYRVRVSPLPTVGGTLVVAMPLGDVADTLKRLLLVEVLVTGAVLAAALALGLWLVRLGLRPLDDIGATAATIARGDLTGRVARAETRTEVGRLGQALNAMLAQIEAAFTERRASEARLRQSEARLRRFVADASHELRTPLAAIRAYAELFRRGADRHPEDLPRLMSRIESEAARMGGLVDDLLLLQRLDQGRALERRPVDLGAVAADAVEAARAVEPDRPLRLDVTGSVEVLGDQDRLRQVIDNLLANVRTHTPSGAAAAVRVWSQDRTAVVEVADQGPGLSAEQVEHVFERFYRVDSSRSRDAGGAGLGLSIVAAIAYAHGGRAGVRSVNGKGAVFQVELPLLDETGWAYGPAPEGGSPGA
jgi:two-component system, OmpR family, sensor kinase